MVDEVKDEKMENLDNSSENAKEEKIEIEASQGNISIDGDGVVLKEQNSIELKENIDESSTFKGDKKQINSEDNKGQEPVRTGRKSSPGGITGLLQSAIMKNCTRSNSRLKQHLTGVVQLIITGTGSYILDWREDDMTLKEGEIENADCTIEMNASDFVDAAHGDLNIQIAILSDKVKFKGRAEMASYLFNIFS